VTPDAPRRFAFAASLPGTGTVLRPLGSGKVRLTLEVPKSDQEPALIVSALVGCRFQVAITVAGGDAADPLTFAARLPRGGTVARGKGDGSVDLILEVERADAAAALAVQTLTQCELRVTITVEGDVCDHGRAAERPAPRRSAAKRRIAQSDARL
jgi:hypothetical protein